MKKKISYDPIEKNIYEMAEHEIKQSGIKQLPTNLMEALEESVRALNMQTKGGKIDSMIDGAKNFFKANPGLTVGAAALAVSAVSQYKKNQRNTIKLHAKTPYEKKMMTSIADALTKDGKFKLFRIKFEGGGKTWILRKRWT